MPGFYRPLDSPMHRLDARPKLVLVALVMLLGFFTVSTLFSVLVSGLLISLLLWSGMNRSELAFLAKPMLFGALFTIAFHLLFGSKEGDLLLSLAGLSIYQSGLEQGLFYSLRLIMFLSALAVLTFTASPSDLANIVPWLLSPLRPFRLPINDIGLICLIALRFVPVLHDEYSHIRKAQAIRGARFDGSLITRIRRSVTLLGPIFSASLARADELALALSVRGYQSNVRRTHFSRARFATGGMIAIISLSILLPLLFFFTDSSHG